MSRFMHYLAMWMQDKVAGFATAAQYQILLNNWLKRYLVPEGGEASAQHPLTSGHVELSEGRRITLRASPAYQLQAPPTALRAILDL
jgi:predicted component of type VI protein secretion system